MPITQLSSRKLQSTSLFYLIALFSSLVLAPADAFTAEPDKVDVAKTSGCGCCIAWIDHLEQNDFSVSSRNMAMGALVQYKEANGIGQKHASCHTAKVGGYTVEGHVPASDIRRLLKDRPDAVGLAVPEMPIGSPGMEVDSEREAFDVLLIHRDGSSTVYASYPAGK